MRYVLIDESGRLADPNDKILIFSALVTKTLIDLDKIIPKVRRKIPPKGKYKKEKSLAEIKFQTTGERTRLKVLEAIKEKKLRIFLLIVNKEGRKIADNPKNYSLLVGTLLKFVIKKYSKINHIIIDRHFTWIKQREDFNNLLQKKLNKELFIEHLDSQQNTIVSLPDFIAGGVRKSYTKKEIKYKQIIEKLIEKEIKTTWRIIRSKQKR